MELIALAPDNPLLRLAATEVTPRQLRTNKMQQTIDEFLAYVYGHNNKGATRKMTRPMTVGLSAPQVGIGLRISIVDLAIGSKRYSDIHVLINPKIIKRSKAVMARREGCVNLPRVWGQVERSSRVTVQALDRSGNKLTLEVKGWPAALLQHEIDHLDGQLFIDHLLDPSKAHFLDPHHAKEYNRKTAATWPYLVDVSHLVRN